MPFAGKFRNVLRLSLLLGAWAAAMAAQAPDVSVAPARPACTRPAAPGDATLFTAKDPLYTAALAVRNWWPGDGHAMDLVSTRHATLKDGASFEPGRVGWAFTFKGDGGYVDCGKAAPSTPEGAFTFLCWFRAEAQPGFQYLAFCWGAQGMDLSVNNIEPSLVGCNLGRGIGWDQFRGTDWEGANAIYKPLKEWHQVAFTYDGRRVCNYRDGALAKEVPWAVYAPSDTPLLLGAADRPTGCRPLKGQIQDVALFARALSAAEIAAVYEAQTAPKPWKVTKDELARFEDSLNGATAPAAWYAAVRLPAAGDAVAAYFAAANPPPAAAAPEIRALIQALDADSYAQRENAMAALRDLGPSIKPHLLAALRDNPAPEAASRLNLLLQACSPDAITPQRIHTARVAAILTRIDTPQARSLRKHLTE